MSKNNPGFNELTDSGLQLTYGLPVNEASVRAILVGGGAVTLELDSKPATIPLSTYAAAGDWLRLVFKDNNDTYEYETAQQWSKESAESDTPSPLPPVEGNDGQLLMSQNGQWAPVDAEGGFGYKEPDLLIIDGRHPSEADIPCPNLNGIIEPGDHITIEVTADGVTSQHEVWILDRFSFEYERRKGSDVITASFALNPDDNQWYYRFEGWGYTPGQGDEPGYEGIIPFYEATYTLVGRSHFINPNYVFTSPELEYIENIDAVMAGGMDSSDNPGFGWIGIDVLREKVESPRIYFKFNGSSWSVVDKNNNDVLTNSLFYFDNVVGICDGTNSPTGAMVVPTRRGIDINRDGIIDGYIYTYNFTYINNEGLLCFASMVIDKPHHSIASLSVTENKYSLTPYV